MIEIKNVNKKFKNNEVFHDLNAFFPAGEKSMIKGPNGSGKSVLLRLIVGYSRPDSGVISVDGSIIGKDVDFIENAGVSIDAPEFIRNCTGRENLEYLANIRKIATKQEIDSYIRMFHLEDDIDKKYKVYSLGMKQKLRIIQALLDHPKHLILDEPFDSLDESSVKTVMNVLNNLCNDGITIVFTNHISEYDSFADLIYQIDNRRLVKKYPANL